MKVLLFGAGALGSAIGGLLHQAGHDVALLGREYHLDAIRQDGLRIDGLWGQHHIRGLRLFARADDIRDRDWDVILITVKAYDTGNAIEACRRIAGELLGLPPEDRPRFTRWASTFSTAGNWPAVLWGLTGVSKMMQYVRAEIRRQRRQPREGLLAGLIEAEEAGDRLSEDELVAMVFLLLAAGHETTLHQIAGSVLELLDHPDQLRLLTSDWELADSAVQELLRHFSFGLVTKPRYALADTEFHGQTIRRGQLLLACLAAANSDPQVFENPERLDIRRQPNRHVAFGAGIHVCLGAKLARVETAIALEGLFTRWPNLQLAIPRSQVRFSSRIGTRGLLALPVRW